jgi:hypothetical protein
MADIITKANETMWNPEDGFNKNAKSFHLPWKVFDSISMSISLKKDDLGYHCPQTDSGMTVLFNFLMSLLSSFYFYLPTNNF